MIEERRLKKEVTIPEGVSVIADGGFITVKGPKGEIKRKIFDPTVSIAVADGKVLLSPKKLTKKQKALINSYLAHIKNMMSGVQNAYQYKMKVCSSHFPMSVSVEGSTVVIKNFFGEKVARKAKIAPGVKVEAKGDIVTVSGVDIEAVGQTCTNIELALRITNRDRRVFQDGVWLFEKGRVQ
ncbi:MAG: 50S ribosomal protein L6 [Candidatus Nanoarchaeia archaeon]|nr:50S ribosomal protein L6 [Candidatus Nanoarchaeia archaeon]